MDWLLTSENMAAAIVLSGFWLFTYVLCRVAR
jgi:hypothetical protein